ncbi:hypothetical protein N0V90_000002 [Kalmusia sp. IMI 367209]|nr:hypothetical protein N0V90_000002 [Kalmusia sp. IMI 367209]
MLNNPESKSSLLKVEPMPQQIGVPSGLDWTGQGAPNVNHLRILLRINVNIAFEFIAQALGALDHHDYNAISPFNKLGPEMGINRPTKAFEMPENLRPTRLQLTIEHHPWIDFFPLPRMRDNILMAVEQTGVCDEDELCRDLCHYDVETVGKAGLIVWGEASDPRNWEASTEFLQKWGYLLCDCTELLESTNYWRFRRDDKPISMETFSEAIIRSFPIRLEENST